MSETAPSADFAAHLARWQAWAATPWGRIRFAVVRRTLSWQVAALGGGPLRVLDVGGGDGRDSVPLARDGHEVTVLDTSPGMLHEVQARARQQGLGGRLRLVRGSVEDLATSVGGGFDMVLCHFLLHYRPAETDDLRALCSTLRPGGRLSVIAPNPPGAVLARLVRQGPAAAAEELDRRESESATFGREVRKIECEEMARDMSSAGLDVVARYGGRCANELLVDDDSKHGAEYFSDLERLELALCDREPYKRLGQFWQLVGERRSR